MRAFVWLICSVLLVLSSVGLVSASPAKLDQFWNNQATWQLRNKLVYDSGYRSGAPAGTNILIVEDKWYLVSRKIASDGNCPSGTRSWTVIRESTNQGYTWSSPSDLIINNPGTPWECNATDGSLYYDQPSSTWHYLFQCTGRDLVWNGCYAYRTSLSPIGGFITVGINNPVINSGQLWRQICQNSQSNCPTTTIDEGTFNIFGKVDDKFGISFHGYDGVRGYRGVAFTSDFKQFTPHPISILDYTDLMSWREQWQGTPIGFGAGTILKEGDYYYTFNEAADLNLVCTPNQNWDWGFLRSSDFTSWQQLPQGNPYFYSSKYNDQDGHPVPCAPSYGGIFRDSRSGQIYLHLSRPDISSEQNWKSHDGLYIYELVPKNNLLENSNFWKCNLDNWSTSAASNVQVLRYPSQSADGTCFAQIQSGNLSQSINLNNSLAAVTVSAQINSPNGASGQIVVIEEGGREYRLNISPTNNYSLANSTYQLNPNTKKITVRIETLNGILNVDQVDIRPNNLSNANNLISDLNKDGLVNLYDFNIFLGSFGNQTNLAADLNLDGLVNLYDFNIFITNY